MEFLIALVVAFLAAAIPTVAYVTIAWWLDRYEKEPLWLMTLAFLWGAVPAIIVAAVVELVFAFPFSQFLDERGVSVVTAAIIAPLVEEPLKALPLLLIFWMFRYEFDGMLDGLLYGALVGFGFAMTENVMYIMGAYSAAGYAGLFGVAFLRVIVFGMMHALWASMFGLGLGISRYAQSSFVAWMAPIVGLALGMMLHAIHNFCGVSGGYWMLLMLASYGLGCVGWLVLVILAGLQEQRWIREELEKEVANGHVRADIATATSRYRSRIAARWAAYRQHGVGHAFKLARLYSLVADLAFKKRQMTIHPQDEIYGPKVVQLRDEIADITEALFGEDGMESIEEILEIGGSS